MSGYQQGQGYPYGAPPAQPYGAPPAQPYAAPPYGAPQQYGGSYGAPPPAGPYGAQQSTPYGQPAGEKPPKAQQGSYQAPQQYGSYGSPPAAGPYGAQPSAPYAPPAGEKPPKAQQGSGYQPSAPTAGSGYQAPPGAYGSAFAALVPSQFPPGTDPAVAACFQAADQDGSGFIDDKELQFALSSYNQSFSIRTVHLLMYLFTSSNVRKIGPKEFTSVFYSLQNWRAIFERADRDRSGKIDLSELSDALLNLGFSVSPVVLDLLVSKFDKTGGKSKTIEYDNFIECCLTVKGLTEKFKEKDVGYTGSATFNYESFMLTVLPFLIA